MTGADAAAGGASFDRLAAMIADLDGFINRRAAEQAAPLIDAARAEAAMAVAAAGRHIARLEAELTRARDLIDELRRHVDARNRQLDRWHEATGFRDPGLMKAARPHA